MLDIDIYIVSSTGTNDHILNDLCAGLPDRHTVLLADIDTAGVICSGDSILECSDCNAY